MKSHQKIGQALLYYATEHNIELNQQEAQDWGVLIELYLSHIILDTPSSAIRDWQYHLKDLYGEIKLKCNWYEDIWLRIKEQDQDYTILSIPDSHRVYSSHPIEKSIMFEAFDFCREGF